MLLPSICTEIYKQYATDYGICHFVLDALAANGNNVRYWLFEGCYKYEIYQAKEWVKPCPSHVMCAVLKQPLDAASASAAPKGFCEALPMENPFAKAAGPAGP